MDWWQPFCITKYRVNGMKDKIIIACTVSKKEDPVLFDYLSNIKARLRATHIRLLATEHIIRRQQGNVIVVQQSGVNIDREMPVNHLPNHEASVTSHAEQTGSLGNLGELFSELADSNSLFI